MNQESIDRWSRHIKDVPRIESDLEEMSAEEAQKLLEAQKERVSARWSLCNKSFKMLFMTLNRGKRFPADSFDIRIKHETHGEATYDTYIRVWRSKDHEQFFIKAYVDCGHRIYDHTYETESFGTEYEYRYGTHGAHSAKLHISKDDIEPELQLTRINGRLIESESGAHRAVFLAAIESTVIPSLESTEESLALMFSALLDSNLNPELAERASLHK